MLEELFERLKNNTKINIDNISMDNDCITFFDKMIKIQLIRFLGDNERNLLIHIEHKNKNYGYKTIFIYEDELLKIDFIYNKISHILNISENNTIIHARKCEFKIIYGTIKNHFLNENHIQGEDRSTYNVGAYYCDELVAVMTFDNKRGMSGGNEDLTKYELKRFCVKNGYIISGIANRIIKFFTNNYTVNTIISFADLRWTLNIENNIYTKLGFTIEKVLPVDYSYYDGKHNRIHKFSFGKNKLKIKYPDIYNEKLTEYEMTKMLGLSRIFDLGKIKYIYINKNNKTTEKHFYIYKITRMVEGIYPKVYIGQTARPYNLRFNEYKKKYGGSNDYLKKSFVKYGFDNFKFEVIKTCNSLDELNEREIYYIKFYDSSNRDKGYNIELGGGKVNVSDETRLKLSKAHKGRKQDEEWIEKRKRFGEDHHCYGKKHSEEYKQNLSDKMKGENSYWFGKKRDLDNGKQTKREKYGRKVSRYNIKTGEVIDTFNSIGEAIEKTGVVHSTISKHCNNRVKQYKTDISWKYVE